MMWFAVGLAGAAWQLISLTTQRVNPKREEELYERLSERFGGEIPEKYMKETIAMREYRDTLTLQNALDTPTPGETTAAMQPVMDYRKLAELKNS